MAVTPGTRLGAFEIVAALGAGGMGEVYRARDQKLDRDVAIKVLPQSVAADPDMLARFEREAKAVAALSHQNILAIHDFGNQDGIAYAVMELLEGETLRGKLDAGPITQKQAVDYALQIARGLSAAHGKGWRAFAVLLVAGLLGVVAILPYMMELVGSSIFGREDHENSTWRACGRGCSGARSPIKRRWSAAALPVVMEPR